MKQMPSLRFILEDGIFIVQDKTGWNADLVYDYIDDLCEISNGWVLATTAKNI